MRLSVLSSGSSGNATYIGSDGGGLLVDAGLSCKRIGNLLARIGLGLNNVDAVLLTHGHADHTCGVRSLVRERGVSVYAAPGVGRSLGATPCEPGDAFPAGGFEAAFFPVPHDDLTFGVRVTEPGSGRAVALATDFGEAGPETLRALRGADAVVLEANHDPDWLRRGPYSADLKRRISSRRGHLSNRQAADAAVALAPHGLKDLVLAHLSKTNNSPARACGTVHGALREAGFGAVRVRAAIAGHPTPTIDVGEPLEGPAYVYRYAGGGDGGGARAAQQLFEMD